MAVAQPLPEWEGEEEEDTVRVTDPEPQGEGVEEEELQGVAECDGLGDEDSVPDSDVENVAEAQPLPE